MIIVFKVDAEVLIDQLFNCSRVLVAKELIMEPIYLDHLNPLICHGSGNKV